jgi:hypothetical protein
MHTSAVLKKVNIFLAVWDSVNFLCVCGIYISYYTIHNTDCYVVKDSNFPLNEKQAKEWSGDKHSYNVTKTLRFCCIFMALMFFFAAIADFFKLFLAVRGSGKINDILKKVLWLT